MKLSRPRLYTVFGLLAVSLYLIAALAARAFYPASFGPLANWLSDLGNNDLNPAGAWLYRLGGIMGGSGLLAFFLMLDSRSWGERRAVRVLSVLVRIFGVIASASFIMTGVFSEDMMPMHSWFSMANFASFGTAIAITGCAWLLGATLPKSFAVLCFVAWGVDIVSAIFGQTRWLEWVVVLLLIAFVATLSVVGPRAERGTRHRTRNGTKPPGGKPKPST